MFGREITAERSNGTGTLLAMRRSGPCLITPTLPPTPAGLSHQQLKRRHIVAAIIHSENSYVATLQRLVNVRFLFCFVLFIFVRTLFISHLFYAFVFAQRETGPINATMMRKFLSLSLSRFLAM